jgi:hypothetical protein
MDTASMKMSIGMYLPRNSNKVNAVNSGKLSRKLCLNSQGFKEQDIRNAWQHIQYDSTICLMKLK